MRIKSIILFFLITFLLCACSKVPEQKQTQTNTPPSTPPNTTHEHTWSEYVVRTEPTCYKAGEEVSVCSTCGEERIRKIVVSHQSDEKWEKEKEATCAEPGILCSHCIFCGEEMTQEIEPLEHTLREWTTTIEPTTTTEGREEARCSVCDTVVSRAIPKRTFNVHHFSKTELVTQNNVSITLSKVTENPENIVLDFLVENKSEKEWQIAVHTFAVKTVMIGWRPYDAEVEVVAESKGKFSLEIDKKELEEVGIYDFDHIEILFWAYKPLTNSWIREWYTDIIHIYSDDYTESTYEPVGQVVSDDKYSEVRYIGCEDNEYKFVLFNKTKYNTTAYVKNCVVDGWTYDLGKHSISIFYSWMPMHTMTYAYFKIPVDDAFIKENEIKDTDSIYFDLEIKDDYSESLIDYWKSTIKKIKIK